MLHGEGVCILDTKSSDRPSTSFSLLVCWLFCGNPETEQKNLITSKIIDVANLPLFYELRHANYFMSR
jgi:hypothetical protein